MFKLGSLLSLCRLGVHLAALVFHLVARLFSPCGFLFRTGETKGQTVKHDPKGKHAVEKSGLVVDAGMELYPLPTENL